MTIATLTTIIIGIEGLWMMRQIIGGITLMIRITMIADVKIT